ncbi:hypothetical protein BH24DEI2_BH24DEI2_19730 [soil metagenome]
MKESSLELHKRRANVTQGNALARSAQQMTLYEKRLIYVAIASISREQTAFETTEIPVAELERLFGVNTKAIYRIAKETALSLLERTILIGSDEEGWTAFQWVSRARYVPANKHPNRVSSLQITFHEDLKPYLLQLRDNFNSMPLLELLSIPSFNSARLFEVLHHDSFRGQKTFITYDIEDLKKRIGLEGKYAKFKDFRYVLDRAQADFAAYTGLIFSYTGVQQGRSYTQLRFRIVPNPDYQPPGKIPQTLKDLTLENFDEDTRQLTMDLAAAGFTQDALETIHTYGFDRVKSNLALAKKKAKEAEQSTAPIRNLGGLITYMLEHDIASKDSAAQAAASEGLTPKKVSELAALLKEVFEAALREASEHLQAALSEDELGDLHDIMRVELSKFTLAQLDKQDWQGPSYEAAFNTTLYRKRRHLFPERLHSLAAYTEHEELFGEYDEAERAKIIEEADALL